MMGEKQIEVLVTLGAGGRSMGWSMAMSGGVFLLGKSQKRDISSFPGSLGPFSDHSPQSPRNFSLLERKTSLFGRFLR